MIRNPSGYHLFFDTVKLPNGALWQAKLPDGEYQVRIESPIESPIYLPQVVTAPLPFNPDPFNPDPYRPITLDLLPNYLYPFSEYGSILFKGYVQNSNKKSIKDVVVSTTVPVMNGDQPGTEDRTFTTDAGGQWVLDFPNNPAFRTSGPQANTLLIQLQFALPDGTTQLKSATLEKGKISYLGRIEL